MKERPIIFNSEMVRAILDGRKTMTRRVIKPQPEKWITQSEIELDLLANRGSYKIGMRLWVRETWLPGGNIAYKATSPGDGSVKFLWKPSIFMPRWASRITLEVVGVKVERVQEITEEDAMAEGVAIDKGNAYHVAGHEERWAHKTAKGCFETLWDSINGKKYPWSSNPFCWVIEFKHLADKGDK